MDEQPLRPLQWVGSAYRDLKALPQPVCREIGFALYMEQKGERYYTVKPLKGLRGVLEIVSDYATDTYRAVYAVKLGQSIYVLHAFQKKSKRGSEIPRQDLELIRRRLQTAREMARKEQGL